MGHEHSRLRMLTAELARRYPRLGDPDVLIAGGEILVNGFPRTNPASLVSGSDAITVRSQRPLRGAAKLAHALSAFDIDIDKCIGLDLGASAGGFTQVLLAAGAARVYAVDTGHGQLRGELRRDPRVINLERTNLGQLCTELVPDPVDVVTIDLSYLSLAAAAPQLEVLDFAPAADLIALVKPVYELGLATLSNDACVIATAVQHAADGLTIAGWFVTAAERSPVPGARGAIEWLLHAQRRVTRGPASALDREPGHGSARAGDRARSDRLGDDRRA